MIENDIIRLKNDLAFKLVFGRDDDRCRHILKNLLQTILKIEIDTIEYRDPINLNESIDYKQTEFDISITVSGKINCDIEIQLRNHDAFNHRLVYYGATLLSGSLDSKESYSKMKRAIVICLTDFVMFKAVNEYQSNFVMKDRENNHELSDILEIVTLEMPKVESATPVSSMTDMEKWLTYVKYNGYEEYREIIEEIVKESEAIEMAEKIFGEVKNNDQMRTALLSRQRFQYDINAQINDSYDKGLEHGLAHGFDRGKFDEKITMALNMLNFGLSIEAIAKISGLSTNEILALKDKI